MIKRLTTEEFVARAKSVHGDKFDYSKVNYINAHTKICIICPQHGEFWQVPDNHVRYGHGCLKCAKSKSKISIDSQKEFIQKSKLVHKNKYDYSLVNYQGVDKKVNIVCPEHGIFVLSPYYHLKGRGCPKCTKKQLQERTSVQNQQIFLEKAKNIHGDKYDYSLVKYKNNSTKVKIICQQHGEFEQAPQVHLRSGDCPYCAKLIRGDRHRKLTEDFIQKAKQTHGDSYDYSKSEYRGYNVPVEIICPKHGEFWQLPTNHCQGKGCPKCKNISISEKLKQTPEEFIQKARQIHNNKYDYSQVQYINSWTPVSIICPVHGLYYQKPVQHINHKAGCPKCSYDATSERLSLTTEEFIRNSISVHGDLYDYSQVQYVNQNTPVKIICATHGMFMQKPVVHYNCGCGCPKCTLKSQTKVFERLCEEFPEENIMFEVGKNILDWLDRQRLDIYFPKYNIAVEYDGKQHYEPVKRFGGEIRFSFQKEEDAKKSKKCKENGCELFRLRYDYSEDDFNKLVNKIKEIIQNHGEDS